MDQLSCIIVEDEVLARTSLERLCKKSDYLDLKSSFENGEDVGEYLKTHAVDLILLDIELPGISGIDLLEQLAFLPQIIFTTSNKEYAYEAYEYEITDFLKKPVTQNRFAKAIDKAVQIYQHQHEVSVASAQNEIYVKVDKKFVRLALEEIQYFENVGDYVRIVADSGSFTCNRVHIHATDQICCLENTILV